MFSRERKLTFKQLVVFILSTKRAIQRELDGFFKKVSDSDFSIRHVTKSAFSQSRAKLKPEAFVRLNEIAVNTFYRQNLINTWKGFRILAVDGSRIVLPNHPSIVKEFGQHMMGPNADSPRSLALISLLYDVLNHLTIDAQIAPYSDSERDLLDKHINKIDDDDLLLLDRGYPSIRLMFELQSKGINFCIRMKDDWWLKVKDFTESTEQQRIVEFKLPKKDHKYFAHCPEITQKPIRCRLVKIDLPTGEKEILCTSLLDYEEYPYDQFDALYHTRWNVEEAYKLLKSRAELEDFSGKTAIAVKQDFFAKVFLMSLCAAYAYPIEEKVRKEYASDKERKHSQQINHTNALAMTKDILVPVFLKLNFKKAIEAFDHIVYNTRELVRPGRKNPRKHRPKKLFPMNHKQL